MFDLKAMESQSTALAFGLLFKSYREELGHSQRKLARLLDVDESTIARIETGTRKPPRKVEFYERLRKVPGLTEAKIASLLETDDAPRWLVAQRDTVAKEDTAVRSAIASGSGVRVSIVLQANNSELALTDKELDTLKNLVKEDVEQVLANFFERRAKRAELAQRLNPD